MKTKHLNIEMGFAPSCPLITLNATFAMMRGTYIQTHFQNLIYPSDQSSPGALDPPLPTHERYQNSNANFGFRGSCQMRQNVCHPHRPASTLSIDPVGWIRAYMGGIPDEEKQRFSGYPTAFPCKVGNYPCAFSLCAGSVYLRSILRH